MTSPPPFPSSSRAVLRLGTLPPHLLLRVVYALFTVPTSIERQRKTLYWLTIVLRLVNRAFYIGAYSQITSQNDAGSRL